jgi:hypothetical protein
LIFSQPCTCLSANSCMRACTWERGLTLLQAIAADADTIGPIYWLLPSRAQLDGRCCVFIRRHCNSINGHHTEQSTRCNRILANIIKPTCDEGARAPIEHLSGGTLAPWIGKLRLSWRCVSMGHSRPVCKPRTLSWRLCLVQEN